MTPAQSQLGRLQVEGAKLVKGSGADAGEFVEELRQGLSFALLDVASTIERLEGARLAVFENHAGSREPVDAVAEDEVADDVRTVKVSPPSLWVVQSSGRSRRSALRVAGVRERRAMVWGRLWCMRVP